jgi:hypothetical protein
MAGLSCKQKEILELPLVPICVTACAGSGKTRTAVHRLEAMRRLLDDRHGMIALLSFSNVAVDTFRKDYFAPAGVRTGGSTPVADVGGRLKVPNGAPAGRFLGRKPTGALQLAAHQAETSAITGIP